MFTRGYLFPLHHFLSAPLRGWPCSRAAQTRTLAPLRRASLSQDRGSAEDLPESSAAPPGMSVESNNHWLYVYIYIHTQYIPMIYPYIYIYTHPNKHCLPVYPHDITTWLWKIWIYHGDILGDWGYFLGCVRRLMINGVVWLRKKWTCGSSWNIDQFRAPGYK